MGRVGGAWLILVGKGCWRAGKEDRVENTWVRW